MSVDPKILARMKAQASDSSAAGRLARFERMAKPPEDDGSEGAVLDDEPNVETEAPLPADKHPGCALLRGSWKQRKWAIDIRNKALALEWPDDTRTLLSNVNDATWWIANGEIVNSMKFKNPLAHQIAGGPPPPPRRPVSPEPAPAASRTPHEKRVDDAMLWAESVSRHPTLAQAAILSCLRFVYPKGAMRDQLTAKARELLAQGNMEVNRDMDAITLMLSKE